jgi:hypothetical protein
VNKFNFRRKSKKDEKEIDVNIECKNIESRYVEVREG